MVMGQEQLPRAWRMFEYKLRTPLITEERSLLLQFILKISEVDGTNPFTLLDCKGEKIVTKNMINKAKFEILAEHYGF